MTEQALSDVRVLDLTWHIAGPWCTKLLADYGADVIKVERPGTGDPSRGMGPFLKDDPHPEKSGLFLYLNTNKRGVTLNFKTEAGKKILKEMIRDADILVESFSPGVMVRFGLDYQALERINPKLVMTSISNFGQTGPYRDFKSSDLISYAMGGAMNATGVPSMPPVGIARDIVLYEVGYLATVATMGAYLGACGDGIGDHVDVSVIEALNGSTDRRDCNLLTYGYTGFTTPRLDPGTFRFSIGPFGSYPTTDGHVLALLGLAQWPRFAAVLGQPDLPQDPRFQNIFDVTHAPDLDAILLEWLAPRTKQEAAEEMQNHSVGVTPVNSPEDVVRSPHWRERGFFVEIDHPVAGKLTYPGAPIDATEAKWELRRPAPLLGQHNEEVYEQLGYGKEDLVKLRGQGAI